MVMATRLGEVKKTQMKFFANVRRDGLIAMDLEAEDELVSARICRDEDDLLIVKSRGPGIGFNVPTAASAAPTGGGATSPGPAASRDRACGAGTRRWGWCVRSAPRCTAPKG